MVLDTSKKKENVVSATGVVLLWNKIPAKFRDQANLNALNYALEIRKLLENYYDGILKTYIGGLKRGAIA